MKKILFVILFLLICSKAEAAPFTYYAIHAGGNWTAGGTWSTISAKDATRVGGAVAPTSADTCYLDNYSGDVTIDGASACLTLDENGNGAYGGTLAFGTQTLTVSGLATIGSKMTSTSGTLSVGGGVTLLSTITGTFPLLKITGASTLTSGNFTWPGALTFNINGTVVLKGQWIVTGLVTNSTSTLTLNKTGVGDGDQMTCNGGLTVTSAMAGSTTMVIGGTGGTVQTGTNSTSFSNNLTFNCTTATIGTNLAYRTGTMTYTAGTITTTASTLSIPTACTLATRLVPDTGGITWNNITMSFASGSTVLTSNLNCTGTISIRASSTITGAYNISCGKLYLDYFNAGTENFTLVAGQTLTVTNGLYVSGDPYGTYVLTIKAPSTSVTYLNYTGTLTNEKVCAGGFTYISTAGATWVTSYAYAVGDLVNTGGSKYLCAIAHTSGTFATDLASGDWTIQNTKNIFNYCGGTLTNTSGITNINANNIGGFYIN